mgnify:CR=1 FL=1
MNIPSSITTLLIGIAITAASFWYGQNHGLMPVEASVEAPLVDGLFDLMMTIGTGLFLIVQGAIVYSAFKFRQKPGDNEDGAYIEGNIPLEILWTSIPAVIVLGIAVYSFEVYTSMGGLNPMDHSMAHGHATQQVAKASGAAIAAPLMPTTDPEAKAAIAAASEVDGIPGNPTVLPEMTIETTALQYAWLFTYPDSGVVAGELHVPVGTRVHLKINANDVLHAFWVPEYRLKQDAIPGQTTELTFTPNRIGEYPVVCAELCGPYHGAMKSVVVAQSPADFNAWFDSQKVASSDVDAAAIALSTHSKPAAEQTPAEFLAPFVEQMGLKPEALQQMPHHHAQPAAIAAS